MELILDLELFYIINKVFLYNHLNWQVFSKCVKETLLIPTMSTAVYAFLLTIKSFLSQILYINGLK